MRLEVTAVKKVATPPPPEAKIEIQIRTTKLPLNQWEKLEGVVTNVSSTDLRSISLEVVGSVQCHQAISLGNLPANTSTDFSMPVRASESGNSVPFTIELKHTDIFGRSKSQKIDQSLRVIEMEKKEQVPSIKIKNGRFLNSIVGEGTVDNRGAIGTQHNYAPEQKQNLAEAAVEIQQLLEQLSQAYPTTTNKEKMAVVAEVADKIENNPTLKARLISTIKAGLTEALKEAIDHPLANILMASIEGYKEVQ